MICVLGPPTVNEAPGERESCFGPSTGLDEGELRLRRGPFSMPFPRSDVRRRETTTAARQIPGMPGSHRVCMIGGTPPLPQA